MTTDTALADGIIASVTIPAGVVSAHGCIPKKYIKELDKKFMEAAKEAASEKKKP